MLGVEGVPGHCYGIDGERWHPRGQCKGASVNCSGRCCTEEVGMTDQNAPEPPRERHPGTFRIMLSQGFSEQEAEEAIESIERGLADMKAGRTVPLSKVIADLRPLLEQVVRKLEALTVECPECRGVGGFTERTGPTDVDQYACPSCMGHKTAPDPAYALLLDAVTEPCAPCRDAECSVHVGGTGRRVRDVETLDGSALFDALPRAFGVNVNAETFTSGGCTVFAEGLATVSAPTLKEAVLRLLGDERMWENAALPEVKA